MNAKLTVSALLAIPGVTAADLEAALERRASIPRPEAPRNLSRNEALKAAIAALKAAH